MTVIRPNSISGINSITGQGGDITIFRADGTTADLIVNNVTTGIVTATTFIGNLTGNPTGSGANLTSLNASNLSSGSVPSARITQGSVTQYVTPFDDDKIVNDISTLALKVSALENSTASNTNSTFVDTYQDSAGISTITNAVRNTVGEYVSSISETTVTYNFNTAGTHGQPQLFGLTTQTSNRRAAYWPNDQVKGYDSGSPSQYGMTVVDFAFDLSGDFTHYIWWRTSSVGAVSVGEYPSAGAVILPVTTVTAGTAPTLNGSSIFTINSTTRAACQQNQSGAGSYGPQDTSTNNTLQNTFSSAAYSTLNIAGIPNSNQNGNSAVTRDYSANANASGYFVSSYHNGSGGYGADGQPYGIKFQYTRATNTMIMGYVKNASGDFKNDTKITVPNMPTTGRVICFAGNASSNTSYFSLRNSAGVNGSGSYLESAANATGSYQSTTINAAATTSKMGVVITYTDHAGTATLNTDLKVFLSADNGTNYTQVTLVAQPNFATGVKLAKANDVTISNTGTQLKYKVEFANQASGSKETRVNGVSLQY